MALSHQRRRFHITTRLLFERSQRDRLRGESNSTWRTCRKRNAYEIIREWQQATYQVLNYVQSIVKLIRIGKVECLQFVLLAALNEKFHRKDRVIVRLAFRFIREVCEGKSWTLVTRSGQAGNKVFPFVQIISQQDVSRAVYCEVCVDRIEQW